MSAVTTAKIDTAWVDRLPELDDKQAGALRRILDLANRAEGDWSGMMGSSFVGEDFGAIRFQIAYMAYTLALTHAHRLPAAPGLFHKPFDRMIKQIMHPDSWMYWSYISTGNGVFNKALGPLPQKWDPVEKDNIMYSAYLQSMVLMYHYLFRDDKYTKPESLTLELRTRFWNEGGFRFPYDEKSLNDTIYWQMAENGFLGVACEPDCVFQICNQPNLIGFRMHDLMYGGDLAEQATKGYLQAWKEFGMMQESGDFTTFILEHNRTPVTFPAVGMNFWLMTLLHSWYPEIVEKQYPIMMERSLRDGPDGTKWIEPLAIPGDPPDAPLLPQPMAWGAACAAEVGDTDTLAGLLAYADRFGNAVWEDGAYYYKRRDTNYDENGVFIGMDVASGNSFLALARLNVKDGLKKLYDGPWDDRHFKEPALVDLPADLDVRRAYFDPKRNALALTLGNLPLKRRIKLAVGLPDGRGIPMVFKDGAALESEVRRTAAGLTVELDHGRTSSLVFQW